MTQPQSARMLAVPGVTPAPAEIQGGKAETEDAHKENERLSCEIAMLRREQKQMQEIVEGAAYRVMEEQERTEAILCALGQGLFGLDTFGCVQFVNPACEHMMGCPQEKLLGLPLHDLLHPPQYRSPGCTELTCPLLHVLKLAASRKVDHDVFHRIDGTALPVSYFCTPIYRADVQVGALICFDDISERIAAAQALDDYARQVEAQNEQLFMYCQELTETQRCLEQQAQELTEKNAQILESNLLLQSLATTDGMTGLANHRAFQESFRSVWVNGRPGGQAAPLSLMLIDVDHFKAYNDSFGHPAGDEVLKIVARLLRENMREADLIARYGGEEFTVIAWETDRDAALRLAGRLCQVVEQYPFANRKITISVGVATRDARPKGYPASDWLNGTPDDLIKAADKALYEAKRTGRNRVCAALLPSDDTIRLPNSGAGAQARMCGEA